MVQPEQPQLQRLPLFFRLRTARTANTRIHAKIKMSSTVPIFFPFSESGNHRRTQPASSTGSRVSDCGSSFRAGLGASHPYFGSPRFASRASDCGSPFRAVLVLGASHPCCGPLHPAGRCGLRGCGAASPLSSPLGASRPCCGPCHRYFKPFCFSSLRGAEPYRHSANLQG